jgi:hypothetical protein
VVAAGLLGIAGACAPWIGPARPWQSGGGYPAQRGITDFPHDAGQCLALAVVVVIVGVAGWFGGHGLLSRLVVLVSGALLAFLPFANWVWLGSSAPSPPPRALADVMDHLPHSPSVDAARHVDTSSRGWGLLLTAAAGVVVVATTAIPGLWRSSRADRPVDAEVSATA